MKRLLQRKQTHGWVPLVTSDLSPQFGISAVKIVRFEWAKKASIWPPLSQNSFSVDSDRQGKYVFTKYIGCYVHR